MERAVTRLLAGLEHGLAYVTALAAPDMTIEWISPSVRDFTGWRDDELVGRNAIELVHPDDLGGVLRILDAERETPRPYGDDPARASVNRVRFLTADGSWRALDVGANNRCHDPRVGGFVFVLADRHAQHLTDAVYDAMASGEAIGTIATRIAELVSWQTGRARVRIVVDGLAQAEVGVARDAATVETLVLDGIGTLAVEHPPELEPSEWFRVLLDRAGGLLRVATTRHHGELALRRRLDEKTAIISAVSHDLRSPIAAIQLMSNLLDGDGDALTPDQRRQLASRISADAQHTTRLLADLTSLDRLLHGSGELRLQQVDVGRLVAQVVGDRADGADERSLHVRSSDDAVARADPVLTERIVDNLVANALKHTPAGARIEVSVLVSDASVAIHLDDDGHGVPESERSMIFDAYVRGISAGSQPGSGIGLFLVRTFAEVQGGQVSCEPSHLGGARFVVSLPRERAER